MQCDQIMLYERLDFIIFQMYDLCVQFCPNTNSIMLFSFILLLLPPQKGNEGTQSEAPDRANDHQGVLHTSPQEEESWRHAGEGLSFINVPFESHLAKMRAGTR